MNILNVEKIFTDAVNPNIGRAVTIKKVNEDIYDVTYRDFYFPI